MNAIAPWKKKLPMYATNTRFLMAPIIFVVMLSSVPYKEWISSVLFILGSITDWLDGYWARKYDAHTNVGKFMDPIADKILVLSALVLLIYLDRIGPVAPALLLSRDIFIGGVRSIAAADNVVIAAKPTGKWKAAVQMIAVPCLFVDLDLMPWRETGGFTGLGMGNLGLLHIGNTLLWVSVILSLVSGWDYTAGYFQNRKGNR